MFYYPAFIICTQLFGCEVYTDHNVYTDQDKCLSTIEQFYHEKIQPLGLFSENPEFDNDGTQYLNGGCIESKEKLTAEKLKLQIKLSFGPDKKEEV